LSALVDAALARRGLTHNEFSHMVGMSPSSVSNLKLKNAAAGPGDELIRIWATVLRLTPVEAEEMRELMELAHSTVHAQRMVTALRARLGNAAAQDRIPYNP
jgi:hypothetical protein